ncbi:diguanylate cyclase (GGDEF) domain-containing protein [Lachnospiraceae bacterium JC7]|nr:diguanylate cyclase (GGDEF) domain-containing protein [Lachnospiraceae bacterium JC7]
MKYIREPYISIQTKFATLILACIFFTILVIGGVGIHTSISILDTNSKKIMNVTALDSASSLNNKMQNIVQNADKSSSYALSKLNDWQDLKDPEFRRSYLNDIENVFNIIARTEDIIYSYGIQLNPEISSSDSNVYYYRPAGGEGFIQAEKLDILRYDRQDSKVSWYYQAKDAGTEIWIKPHYDDVYKSYVISYVKPMYKDGVFIGVVGMNIDFSYITEFLDSIMPYEGSIAFLLDNKGHVVYHRNLVAGTNFASLSPDIGRIAQRIRTEHHSEELVSMRCPDNGEECHKLTWYTLKNNMKLVIAAPSEAINAERITLMRNIASASILITIVFFSLTMMMVQRIIRPIHKLKDYASEIADGKLDLILEPESNDEIGDLTVCFRKNAQALKEYVEQIKVLAYRDALTGTKSKIAYQEYLINAERIIQERSKPFSIIIFDVNNLKKINDAYGHTYGDKYIINCCYCFRKNFIHSPFFRIGGDEFVVFLYDNEDYQKRYSILESIEHEMFEQNIPDNPVERRISAAYGIADFDPESAPEDMNFARLFDLADERMYEKKKEMKRMAY